MLKLKLKLLHEYCSRSVPLPIPNPNPVLRFSAPGIPWLKQDKQKAQTGIGKRERREKQAGKLMRQLQRSGKLVRNVPKYPKNWRKLEQERSRSWGFDTESEGSRKQEEGMKEMCTRWAGLCVLLLAGIAKAGKRKMVEREGEIEMWERVI